ncbi:uncharacterized protein LOC122333418 [Puntigrus tetrazona]|uniref:uncharacterized protein LOC122333418 n=1 Tax=Puntigrus tetrazona TaxID=1606681 RepID=UPI001C8A393A|nr:uncharacterized protein LOC122333418 [Puntigrus tetrazona]
MSLQKCMSVAALFMISEGFLVTGPSGPLVVPLGSSVVLPCYVDEPLPLKGLKVIWVRTDANTLVHVYQDYESRPEAQYQDYRDRVCFFTDEMERGNYSVHLDHVRAEDKGFYRCKVYTEQESEETLVEIKAVEHLKVSGSNHPVSASAGEDVTLNCSVDSHIRPEEIDEVAWRKAAKNEIIQVLVFAKNEMVPADERYRDRAHFFPEEIPKGNFSLRLKSVRTEDKGVYACQVHAGNFSANATSVLEQLGFSVLHGVVLFLCIAASGSALLLLYLNRTAPNTNLFLQTSVGCVPNLFMFFAFLFWGVIEGYLSETVACCAHYFLRPLLLLWTAPHSEHFPGDRVTAMHCMVHLQYSLFTNVVYSVLFKSFWEKSLRYEESDRVKITVLFGIMILICIVLLLYLVSDIGHDVLPPLQLIFLFYAFEAASGGEQRG